LQRVDRNIEQGKLGGGTLLKVFSDPVFPLDRLGYAHEIVRKEADVGDNL